MYEKLKLFILLVLIITGLISCSNQLEEPLKSDLNDEELYPVSENISLRSGISFDGDIVLTSTDFIGFNYDFNESLQAYEFTFKMTDEGQKKMTDVSTTLAKDSGELSLWVGDELIVSPRVLAPITGESFNLNIGNESEDNILDLVNQLDGE
jgi:preprotein translocase subunit SecD